MKINRRFLLKKHGAIIRLYMLKNIKKKFVPKKVESTHTLLHDYASYDLTSNALKRRHPA